MSAILAAIRPGKLPGGPWPDCRRPKPRHSVPYTSGEFMAKPNYSHQKKQREQAAKKKRDEKLQRRQQKKEEPVPPDATRPD
jgi:hypothetical protein